MENSGTQMEISLMESGQMTKRMDMVFMCMSMGPNMKVIYFPVNIYQFIPATFCQALGRMIYRMDSELKLGQIVPNSKEAIKMVKNMVKEHILGVIAPNTQDNGWKTGKLIEYSSRYLFKHTNISISGKGIYTWLDGRKYEVSLFFIRTTLSSSFNSFRETG